MLASTRSLLTLVLAAPHVPLLSATRNCNDLYVNAQSIKFPCSSYVHTATKPLPDASYHLHAALKKHKLVLDTAPKAHAKQKHEQEQVTYDRGTTYAQEKTPPPTTCRSFKFLLARYSSPQRKSDSPHLTTVVQAQSHRTGPDQARPVSRKDGAPQAQRIHERPSLVLQKGRHDYE